MEREDLRQKRKADADEMRDGPNRGNRRKWGRAQWKFFRLILFVSVACLLSVFVTVYCFVTDRGCMFLSFIGFPCPGCGLTRANLSFLRGDVIAAFGYHPVFFMPQLIGLLGLGYAFLKKYRRWLLAAIIVCITVFISVWILRVSFFGWRG